MQEERGAGALENADKRLNNGQANCAGGTTRDKRTDDANSFGFGANARQLDGKHAVSDEKGLVLRSSWSHDASIQLAIFLEFLRPFLWTLILENEGVGWMEFSYSGSWFAGQRK